MAKMSKNIIVAAVIIDQSLLQLIFFFYLFPYRSMGNCEIDKKQHTLILQEKSHQLPSETDYDIEDAPETYLSQLTKPLFYKQVIASKNLLSQHTWNNNRRNFLLEETEQKTQIPSLPLQTIENVIKIYSSVKFGSSSRVKIKRPKFQMIAIDPRKFIVMKKTPIWDDYILVKEIGSGSYGCVYLCEERKSRESRAIKSISKSQLHKEELANLFNEFQILGNMDHPNIIKLYQIYQQEKYLFVVTELCEGGNLLSLVNEFILSEDIIRNIMTQLLSAVGYMHARYILHRDIKLDNIVIVGKVNRNNINSIQIKLIDFGVSLDLSKRQSNLNEYLYGTLLYMPPESMHGTMSISWDIWSCGIVSYMLSTREMPYKYQTDEELTDCIKRNAIRRKYLQKIPKDMVLFIMNLLNKSYMLRVSAQKALKDAWLNKRSKVKELSKSVRRETMILLQKYDAKNNLISMIEGYLVTKKINQAERQHLAEIFQSIDEDHSGIIEIEQFRKFYAQNSEFYDADEVDELLLILDKNKSGKIDFNQFISAMCSRRKLFQLQSLSQAFQFFDRDCSGELNRMQVKQILRGIDDIEVEYLFKELDINSDEKICKQEFLDYFERMTHQ